MQKKLSPKEQILNMKSKGIGFHIINENEAEEYLSNNTYYFKLKAYAKNYDQYQTTDHKGQYINLEFAYLKDLSIIDMHLRHYILKTSVDLEHTVKTNFLNDFNNSKDNGYYLVGKFLEAYPYVLDEIKIKKENSYTKDLADKLLDEKFAIWNIVELISLKDFLLLYKFFYEEYPEALTGHNIYYPMQGVRKLRNASAHSNCIINSLRKPYSGKVKYNSKVDSFVANIESIDKISRRNNMSNQVIYDFVTMLYLVNDVTKSNGIKKKAFQEISELVNGRMIKNAEYYRKESSITSTYQFIKKIVDFLYENSI